MAERTARLAAVRDLGDGHLGVWVPYDDRELAKALPGARWDKNLKAWRVSTYFRGDAESLVARLNTKRDGAVSISITALIRDLLDAIPSHLRPPTCKALAKAWHPDTGGDHALMQQLNTVREVIR